MAWRFSTAPIIYEDGWWPNRRWAVRVLGTYAIAALAGGLLFVACAGLYALYSPRETPTLPTPPTETAPRPAAPPDTVIGKSPLVAGAPESVKLIAIAELLESKDKDPQAIRTFTVQAGLELKYPLGFALFYSNGRKTLYYGRPSSSGISFDPSTLKVNRIGDVYCMNILPVRIRGKLLDNVRNICLQGFAHVAKVDDINIDIEPLAGSSDGAAWVLGMKLAQ